MKGQEKLNRKLLLKINKEALELSNYCSTKLKSESKKRVKSESQPRSQNHLRTGPSILPKKKCRKNTKLSLSQGMKQEIPSQNQHKGTQPKRQSQYNIEETNPDDIMRQLLDKIKLLKKDEGEGSKELKPLKGRKSEGKAQSQGFKQMRQSNKRKSSQWTVKEKNDQVHFICTHCEKSHLFKLRQSLLGHLRRQHQLYSISVQEEVDFKMVKISPSQCQKRIKIQQANELDFSFLKKQGLNSSQESQNKITDIKGDTNLQQKSDSQKEKLEE